MSASELLSDLFSGNFSHAWARFIDFFQNTMEPDLLAGIKKIGTDEGNLIAASFKVHRGELSITSPVTAYVSVAKEVFADVVAQSPKILIQDVFATINLIISGEAA